VALQQGHDRVVAVLLENDSRSRVRLPALHIAAKKDDVKAATLLLQTDTDSDTPTNAKVRVRRDKHRPIGRRRRSKHTRSMTFLKLHRESEKQGTKLVPITSPNVNRFSKFFR